MRAARGSAGALAAGDAPRLLGALARLAGAGRVSPWAGVGGSAALEAAADAAGAALAAAGAGEYGSGAPTTAEPPFAAPPPFRVLAPGAAVLQAAALSRGEDPRLLFRGALRAVQAALVGEAMERCVGVGSGARGGGRRPPRAR